MALVLVNVGVQLLLQPTGADSFGAWLNSLLHPTNLDGFLAWSVSLLLEMWIVVAMALFASVTLRSAVTAVMASFVFYVAGRMMGFFLATTNSATLFREHEVNLVAQWLMKIIAMVVPRLDFYAKSHWLIYGAKSYEELHLFLIQSVIFIPLLIAASVIDFKRKQF